MAFQANVYFLEATLRQYAESLRPSVDTFFFGVIQPQLLFAAHCVRASPLQGDAPDDRDFEVVFFDLGAALRDGWVADFLGAPLLVVGLRDAAFFAVLGVAALDLVDFAVPAFWAAAGVVTIGAVRASAAARAMLKNSFIFSFSVLWNVAWPLIEEGSGVSSMF